MEEVILFIELYGLKDKSHAHFHENANGIFIRYNPELLNIKKLHDPYKKAFIKELEALDFIHEDEVTAKISEQDHRLNTVYCRFVAIINCIMNHFDIAYREAAQLLNDVIEHYGNIVPKTLKDETTIINDLLKELKQPIPDNALSFLGLGSWIDKLQAENDLLAQLITEKHTEPDEQTSFRMLDIRKETDKYYYAIISQIKNCVLSGVIISPGFFNKMNAVIDRYKLILNQERDIRKYTIDDHEDKRKN